MVSVGQIFTIILIILGAIALLVFPSFSIWRDTAKSLCVMEQFSYLRSLENVVKNARERDSVYPEYKFKVKECIDCIWFDTEKSSLMIKINGQDTLVNFTIETNFRWIGCDCDSCDQKDGDDYCANLRKDTTYAFKITKDYAKFTGYVDNEGEIQYGVPLSSKPCKTCVDYNKPCGDMVTEVIPCCFGAECRKRPSGLREVNWLGEDVGPSGESWSNKKCLKFLREECNDYTECSIFTSQSGNQAQYPCYTAGDDPTDRCCSPLLSRAQTEEGTNEQPASYCTGYGGCSVYCGNIKCGYVYNSTHDKFTDTCCRPLGEECWYTDNIWQCCAHELYDKTIGETPTQCLEDHCCISKDYNCTSATASYCCSPNDCLNAFNNHCSVDENCKCRSVII